jgi:hypothetical protein
MFGVSILEEKVVKVLKGGAESKLTTLNGKISFINHPISIQLYTYFHSIKFFNQSNTIQNLIIMLINI